MFGKSFCVFFVLCGYVNSAEYTHGIFIRNFSTDVQLKQHKFSKAKLHKIIPATKNGETRTKKISKRGIVMVDSDFDIPSEIYTYEKDLDADDVFGENEGSGTDDYSGELNKTTEEAVRPMSELQKVTNISTVLTQSTAKETKPTTERKDTVASINTEGSGDDTSSTTEEASTKETTTKSYTRLEFDIKVPDICMNSTCGMNDVVIVTTEERINIPEGTNFTLTCMNNNHSHHDRLFWYKSNESEYFLQTLGTNAQLHFNIPDTKLIHSGMYLCVKWVSKETCCNTKSNLIIYEAPLYQSHLLIMGLIILAGIVLCILLSVRKSSALKKYTKEFTERHGNMKNLL